ncbi:MAG TPA: hypothetical protein VJS67_12630 [Pseudonocardiaceae bacterium]|nr:hypothetical protein [Pseudonocardiaceae bacterium]
MSLEVHRVMDPTSIRGILESPPGYEEASVSEERMSAAKDIKGRRLDADQRKLRMQAIKSPGVIEMSLASLVDRVVVATEKNDLALAAIGGNKCGMNSHDVAS